MVVKSPGGGAWWPCCSFLQKRRRRQKTFITRYFRPGGRRAGRTWFHPISPEEENSSFLASHQKSDTRKQFPLQMVSYILVLFTSVFISVMSLLRVSAQFVSSLVHTLSERGTVRKMLRRTKVRNFTGFLCNFLPSRHPGLFLWFHLCVGFHSHRFQHNETQTVTGVKYRGSIRTNRCHGKGTLIPQFKSLKSLSQPSGFSHPTSLRPSAAAASTFNTDRIPVTTSSLAHVGVQESLVLSNLRTLPGTKEEPGEGSERPSVVNQVREKLGEGENVRRQSGLAPAIAESSSQALSHL